MLRKHKANGKQVESQLKNQKIKAKFGQINTCLGEVVGKVNTSDKAYLIDYCCLMCLKKMAPNLVKRDLVKQ